MLETQMRNYLEKALHTDILRVGELLPKVVRPGAVGQVLRTVDDGGQPMSAWGSDDGVSAWTRVERASMRIGGSGPAHWACIGGRGILVGGDAFPFDGEKDVFYIDPADFAAPPGRTLQFRIAAYVATNGSINGANYHFGWSTGWFGGGAGALVLLFNTDYQAGSVLTGPMNLAAGNGYAFRGQPFSIVSPAHFVLRFTNHTTIPAGTTHFVNVALEYRHV